MDRIIACVNCVTTTELSVVSVQLLMLACSCTLTPEHAHATIQSCDPVAALLSLQIAFSSISITLRHYVKDMADGSMHFHHGEA